MARGKSTCVAWICSETGIMSKVFWHNKRTGKTPKEMMKFSKNAKKHTLHKLKEVKS
jgi:ribosomal protein L33